MENTVLLKNEETLIKKNKMENVHATMFWRTDEQFNVPKYLIILKNKFLVFCISILT